MIDYKLILILVLSIVLLYLYNKVDSLKTDLIKTNKSYKLELKKLELLLINNNKFKNTTNIDSDFCKFQSTTLNRDDICKLNNLDKDILKEDTLKTIDILKEKNTTEFSATESDSESNLPTSENFVVYSNENEKISENKEINLVKKYENLENVDDKCSLNEFYDNLTNSLNEKSDENSENINIENLIDRLENEDLVLNHELKINDIKFNNLPSSYLEIIDSSNSNNEDENVKALSDSNIEMLKSGSLSINSDLDYELSENNKDDINNENFTLNTDIQLDNFNTYKLYDLQLLAKENNLTTTKLQNGKVKNKTKKELYNELNKINLK